MKLDQIAARAKLGPPGVPTPAIVWILRWLVRPVVRVAFRPRLEGVEHLPSGPFLLVCNHGASLGAADIPSLAVLWLERFGTDRPLAGFAHPFAFVVWPISSFMRGLGAVPSTYAAGEAVLAAGVPLLVFPGGDHEAAQSVFRGNAVDFGGRVGFVKLARKANVPIVPMGMRGTHFTAPVLLRTRLLSWLSVVPRALGIKRYPLSVAAVLGAVAIVTALPDLGAWRFLLAWAWIMSPAALLPWVPWPLRARIGAPIEQRDLDPDLARAAEQVQAAVQRLVLP